jgi:ATP-dependent RNA helicase RhlE
MTGSGKTAAFLLPILHNLLGKRRGITRALVVAPTRELAAQIAEHLRELAAHTGLTGAAVYGGVAMGPQEQAFRKGVDVLIATPGRLLDHFQYPYARLDAIEYLVLDEADRMLDMGFLPDIRRILQHLPRKRRTLLFSATLPAPIVELAGDMLERPVALNIERKSAPATGITHSVYPVPHELKSHLLLEVLRKDSDRSVLAFTRTKHRANRLADFLERHGVACARIHGNRSQVQRTEALAGFKRGRFRVLVATDIAARGIDVEALGLVVNFDVPHVPEDYIHRVGRTARAEMTGEAYTFVSPDEEGELRAIERHMGKALPRTKVAGFDYQKRPAERLEIPLAERIAAIRARKAEERGRARAKAEGRGGPGGPAGPGGRGSAWGSRPGAGPKRGTRPAASAGRGEAVLAWYRQTSGPAGQGHRDHAGHSPTAQVGSGPRRSRG